MPEKVDPVVEVDEYDMIVFLIDHLGEQLLPVVLGALLLTNSSARANVSTRGSLLSRWRESDAAAGAAASGVRHGAHALRGYRCEWSSLREIDLNYFSLWIFKTRALGPIFTVVDIRRPGRKMRDSVNELSKHNLSQEPKLPKSKATYE